MVLNFVKKGENELTVVSGSNKKCVLVMEGVAVKSMYISFGTNSVEDVDKAIEVLEKIKNCHVLKKFV